MIIEYQSTTLGIMSKEESASALKKMKNDKSLSIRDFTVEFLNYFGKNTGDFIIQSINLAYLMAGIIYYKEISKYKQMMENQGKIYENIWISNLQVYFKILYFE